MPDNQHGTEEGDLCNRDGGCIGRLRYPPVENCSCHICPPCKACVENMLECPVCGWVDAPADGGDRL